MTSVMARDLITNVISNELQTKINFDTVKSLNGKPSDITEGLTLRQKSDSEQSEDGQPNNPILTEMPNLYKQTGSSVSKIPYFFETPVPKYFRETGWFKNEHTWKYVTWAFSKCQTQSHIEVIEGKEIILAPYEFISGRLTSPKECYLTENIFRNQQKMLVNAGFLKKTTNSKTNHYSCYIWVTDRFLKTDNQRNNQPITNHAPTINHKSEDKKIRIKEDHPSIPSFSFEGLIDDSFSKNEEKIHIYKNVYLTKLELDECVKIKRSIEEVKDCIQKIVDNPKRNTEIKDWVNTLKVWKFPNSIKKNTQNNEEIGNKIVEIYAECKGWGVRIYRDPMKDDRGILFENSSSTGNSIPIFISFADGEFKQKASQVIKDKKMKNKPKDNS